jgi:endonuclease/exonuclease/phosphatase family metal-dependent hydrolase
MFLISVVIIVLIVVCLIALLYFSGGDASDHSYEPFDESFNKKTIPIQLGEITIDKLVLNPEFDEKNASLDASGEGAIVRFYKEQINKTEAQALQTAKIEDHSDNIATLNVHFFHPINLEHHKKEVMEAPLKFMKRFNISVLALQEVPVTSLDEFVDLVERSGLYHSVDAYDYDRDKNEPITNMVISRYPLVVEPKRHLPTESPYEFRKRHAIFFRIPSHPIWPQKLFAATHLEVAEATPEEGVKNRIRKNQIRAIMDQNPDFIMGDLNFAEHTPEYDMISKFYKTSKASDYYNQTYTTTPWGTTVDYIWYKQSDPNAKWHIETYSANYPWSDHRPVIGVYSN